jgi:hypothetical protein
MSGQAVKAISRSRWEGGYGADSGRSRGGAGRGAIRPIEASKVAICNGSVETGRFAQLPDIRLRPGERASSIEAVSKLREILRPIAQSARIFMISLSLDGLRARKSERNRSV